MTGPRDPRPVRRAAAAVAVAAAAALGGIQARAATPATPWSQYRAAAHGLLPWAAAGPVAVPANSALRSTDVRFPDGTDLRVNPVLLLTGLRASPTSTTGRVARSALAALAEAPAVPKAVPAAGAAERRLAAILRQPAFAAARQGAFAQAWRWLRTALGTLLAPLVGRVSVPAGVARTLGVIAAAAALAAGVLAAARLLRAGSDRAEPSSRRPPRRAPVPAVPPASAEERLRQGDLRGAVRLIYAEAVREVAARWGVAVRPGWTAHDIRRAAGLDDTWPGFADLAALHDRVLFGPPPPAPGLPALLRAAAEWQAEVRRWSRGTAG